MDLLMSTAQMHGKGNYHCASVSFYLTCICTNSLIESNHCSFSWLVIQNNLEFLSFWSLRALSWCNVLIRTTFFSNLVDNCRRLARNCLKGHRPLNANNCSTVTFSWEMNNLGRFCTHFSHIFANSSKFVIITYNSRYFCEDLKRHCTKYSASHFIPKTLGRFSIGYSS